jgi:hypothetical protein
MGGTPSSTVHRIGEDNWSIGWNQLIGYQREGTTVKHFAAEVLHKSLRLTVEIGQLADTGMQLGAGVGIPLLEIDGCLVVA